LDDQSCWKGAKNEKRENIEEFYIGPDPLNCCFLIPKLKDCKAKLDLITASGAPDPFK
jgi:hypothetical protein